MAEHAGKPKVRFAGFTETWEQRKLGELGSVAMCKRIFKDQTSEEGDVPFYKIGTFGEEPDAYISRELFDEYMTLSDELAMELEEYMPEDIIINARAYKWDNSDNTIKLVLAMAHLELGELKLSDITRRLLTQVD